MIFLGTIGKGSYGRVAKAQLDDKSDKEKALKIQKPACAWEWYVSKEIEHRLQDPDKVSTYVNSILCMLVLYKVIFVAVFILHQYGKILQFQKWIDNFYGVLFLWNIIVVNSNL